MGGRSSPYRVPGPPWLQTLYDAAQARGRGDDQEVMREALGAAADALSRGGLSSKAKADLCFSAGKLLGKLLGKERSPLAGACERVLGDLTQDGSWLKELVPNYVNKVGGNAAAHSGGLVKLSSVFELGACGIILC